MKFSVVSPVIGFSLDGYMGVIVAIFILVTGFKILNETKNSILGEKPSEETVAQIETMVKEFEDQGAIGIHDLVYHDYGPGRLIVSLHAEVDGSGDIYEIHDAIDNLERDLKTELNCLAVVHMDPIALRDEVTAAVLEG